MRFTYSPKGVCSMQVSFDLDGDAVRNVEFIGGCNGNLQAISKLVDGMKADDIVAKLAGNDCGGRGTSCADQFAKAIVAAKQQANA